MKSIIYQGAHYYYGSLNIDVHISQGTKTTDIDNHKMYFQNKLHLHEMLVQIANITMCVV